MFTFNSLSSQPMDEIVFENRNKAYGAYVIRKEYNTTILKAFFYAFLLVGSLTATSVLMNKLNSNLVEELPQTIPLDSLYKIVVVNIENIKEPVKTEKQETVVEKTGIKNDAIGTEVKDDVKVENKQQNNDQQNKGTATDSAAVAFGNDNKGGDKPGDGKGKDDPGNKDFLNGAVDVNPEFPGGEKALMKHLSTMKYPEIAKEADISGTVYVKFVVDKDGSVTDVEVLRPIAGGCSEEAVRVVKAMPKWTPGKVKGQAVRVVYQLPIKFKLK